MLNREIKFNETFEISSKPKSNSCEIRKFFSVNGKIKFRENLGMYLKNYILLAGLADSWDSINLADNQNKKFNFFQHDSNTTTIKYKEVMKIVSQFVIKMMKSKAFLSKCH